MDYYTVISANPKDHLKALVVKGKSRKQFTLLVPRFAPVGPGDQIALTASSPQKTFLISREDPDDLIPISPHFETKATVTLGSFDLTALVTEVTRPEHLSDLAYLEQFHYKNSPFLSDDEDERPTSRPRSIAQGGRRVILLLYLQAGKSHQIAGYIDLQMPLMMCKPRHELFSRPFSHSKRPVHWAVWDQHAIRNYLNLIVRIARVVVSPDFRGLGLARHLVQSAVTYCRDRWQLTARRPIFLEISAEMLNYVDFVTSAGFRYVGHTEGNIGRVVDDLSHMVKGYKVSCGILSLQKKYVTALQRYASDTHQSFDHLLARLREITTHPDPASALTPDEWAAFRPVLRFPRPYFLYPLDQDSARYLDEALANSRRPNRDTKTFAVKAPNIEIKSVSVRAHLILKKTKNVQVIMDCFGLTGDTLNTELIPPLSIRASGGNIILVVGPSGSGKSILLSALDPAHSGIDANLTVRIDGELNYSAGWIRTLPEDIPLFDYFAERYTAERAFSALSKTGLSEAFVFIKPFKFLSRGQQYRAMLADLLLRQDQVWLLDEFCADLDPITAKVVAYNFRKHVIRTGRIALVAAANHHHFLDTLRPTQIILLKAGGSSSILTFREYSNELLYKAV